MTTLHLVDPELRPRLEAWPTIALSRENLADVREAKRNFPLPPFEPDGVTRQERRVAGPAGAPDIGLVIYTPEGAGPFACIYYIHGGGYVGGSAASLEFVHRPRAAETGCVIVAVD